MLLDTLLAPKNVGLFNAPGPPVRCRGGFFRRVRRAPACRTGPLLDIYAKAVKF